MNNPPLGKTDLANINNALKALIEFGQHINNAEASGLNVDEFRQQHDYYNNLWNAMKQVHFARQ